MLREPLCSEPLCRAGLAFRSSEVIYGGVSTARFHSPGRLPAESGPLRLLYAGQLSPDRGLHTLVEAVATMSAQIELA